MFTSTNMFEYDMKSKYESLFNGINLHSHLHCIKNNSICNILIGIVKCVTISALFLSAVGMGILFTLIIKSNNYNIHTGCNYNDTIYRDNSAKYPLYYCIGNDTGKLYHKFGCSINSQNDIWSSCFSIGVIVNICIIAIVAIIVTLASLWNARKIDDYKTAKNNGIRLDDILQNDDDVINLELETITMTITE